MKNSKIANRTSLDRRMFLKASSLAVAAAALDGKADPNTAANTVAAHPKSTGATVEGEPLDWVNVMQGTASTHLFSRGNSLPIAAHPFGMAHWTLQSASDTAWMFQPGDRRIQGFRCTHQLSPWLSDYGQAIFLPICGEPSLDPQERASSWRPERAVLRPYSFRLVLTRYQANVEMIPTERCALLTANFSSGAPPGFLIEIPKSDNLVQFDKSSRTLRFTSTANEGGVPANFATYYVVRFAKSWDDADSRPASGSQIATVRYKTGASVEARIATSFISFEQAERNLDIELGSKPLGQVRAEAAGRWREYFNRITIEGGDPQQRKIFYSCLYRALLFPRTWHELDADGKPYHFSPYTGKISPGVMYADHGYWDVYRAWYPFLSIVFPEKLSEILQGWVNAYGEGGWLPQFPAPGYRAAMTGSLIDAVFGDAAAKGIRGFDLAMAYEALKKHATESGDPDRGYGRRGIEDYLRLGYVAVDHVPQAVAETTDAAYGDFCIAQVARVLGKNDDAAIFLERSRNWRNLFDPTTGFFRGKHENGTWLEPFDEFQWGSPYVEGSAWQHRWDVPHDILGLIDALGGKEHAVAALDKMLASPPIFRVGVYGQEIHEMSEMAAVDFGQYAQSNQPVHHVLYIYAMTGRPDRSQYWVRRVMSELYTLETFPGDEDTGSMPAWFLLSAMGFYPLCPGRAEYVLGSPLFDKVTLNLTGGAQTVIQARGQSSTAVYVSSLLVDGKRHVSRTISHGELIRGANLTFSMQEQPAN